MALELIEIGKTVAGQPHITDVSLRLERGSLNVLLGPTLSGKTSLMRLMAGLDKPTGGKLMMEGRDLTGVPVRRRNVAMVYQQFINYPTLSVYENIASPLKVAGTDKKTIDRKVQEAAELLRLTPMLERKPLELSGGQQQRTAIARALVKGAELVLLDEPLANLDYKLREELRAELPRIFRESGAVFVYATTEPSEALLLGGKTAALHEGRVTQFGPTAEVYRQPRDLTTARAFSDPPLNVVRVQKRDGRVCSPDGLLDFAAAQGLADLPDGTYSLGFRPHHLHIDAPHADAVSVTASVAVSEITGSESFVHVDFGAERWVAIWHGVHELPVDSEVEVWIDPARVFVFGLDERLIVAPTRAEAA
ncbi:ABC transporter ATP-binding protein [Algihabitans albus]|uniref:ABC transporter ATP-binding protein n=1 Tax=Algihabitans albus TaxID=2164067 RepID=UPI000E5CB9BA|nr:ABC transporter ATP-binding protein [Algihabitans albus]